MTKCKLEYIWLDGYKPTQSLRGKTRVESDFSGKLEDCPMWSFDGSSTEQADGSDGFLVHGMKRPIGRGLMDGAGFTPPDGFPEGMLRSDLNNSMREIQASMRRPVAARSGARRACNAMLLGSPLRTRRYRALALRWRARAQARDAASRIRVRS